MRNESRCSIHSQWTIFGKNKTWLKNIMASDLVMVWKKTHQSCFASQSTESIARMDTKTWSWIGLKKNVLI